MEPVEVHNPYAIKISRLSWHYRLMYYLKLDPDQYCRSLCSYFWMLMLAFLICFAGLVGIAITGLIVYVAAVTISDWWYIAAQIIGTMVGVLIVFAIGAWLMECHRNRKRRRQQMLSACSTVPVPTSWELFWKWVKAKKDKVCPPIQFTDLE